MNYTRIIVLTSLAMMAFASNSLLCRAALRDTTIDASSFTVVRLISGALMLWLIVRVRHGATRSAGNWLSALALFIYAAGFSIAYLTLSAGTGALLLVGAVQVTMIGYGIWSGERLGAIQTAGLLLAFTGFVGLLLPGISAPPLLGSLLMLVAGVAWGVYSLRGKGAGDPVKVTAGNFLRSVPLALLLTLLMWKHMTPDMAGFGYAITSGALASGVGYVIWYAVLPALKSTTAATVQLSFPAIAAVGGVALLGEPITLRLVLASAAILIGIALVIMVKSPALHPQANS